MRRLRSLKPDTYTGSMGVYVAGISVNEGAHYPGRPQGVPESYYLRKTIGRALRSQQTA